jgi:hypothetical protein
MVITNPPLPPGSGEWTDFPSLPVLLGATNNPSGITYIKQFGQYAKFKNMCCFTIDIQTSAFTKTTTTDEIRLSLPLPAVGGNNQTWETTGFAQAATPVTTAAKGLIVANNQFLTLATGNMSFLTYGLTGLVNGLGLLNTTCIFRASGWYRVDY